MGAKLEEKINLEEVISSKIEQNTCFLINETVYLYLVW
jgi:hypothetical protein